MVVAAATAPAPAAAPAPAGTAAALVAPAAAAAARTAVAAAAVMVAVAVAVAMYCTDPKSTYNSMKFLCTDSEWACGTGHISHEFFHQTFTLHRRNPLL